MAEDVDVLVAGGQLLRELASTNLVPPELAETGGFILGEARTILRSEWS